MTALLDELARFRRSHLDDIRAADLAHAMAGLVPQATPTAREVHEVVGRIHALVGHDGFGIRECIRVGASLPPRLPRSEAYDLPAGAALHAELGRMLVSHVFEGLAPSAQPPLTPEDAGRALAQLLRHGHLFSLGHVRTVVTRLAERTGAEFPGYAAALGRSLADKLSMPVFTILEDLVTRSASGREPLSRVGVLTSMLTSQTPWTVVVRAAVRFDCRPPTAVIVGSFTHDMVRCATTSARQLRKVLDLEPSAFKRATNYIEVVDALVHSGRLPEGGLTDGLLERRATLELADALMAEPSSATRPSLMAQLPVLCQSQADADLLLALADRLGQLPELAPREEPASAEAETQYAILVSDLLHAASLSLSARTLAPADGKRSENKTAPGPCARTHYEKPTWITDDLRLKLTERLKTAVAAAAAARAAAAAEGAAPLNPPAAPAAGR